MTIQKGTRNPNSREVSPQPFGSVLRHDHFIAGEWHGVTVTGGSPPDVERIVNLHLKKFAIEKCQFIQRLILYCRRHVLVNGQVCQEGPAGNLAKFPRMFFLLVAMNPRAHSRRLFSGL
jgi:hypothetical protein